MNKRRSKALKQLADLLPAAYITRDHSETGRLWELYNLIEEQKIEIENLPLLTEENADQVFTIKYPAMEILNHHKRLKKAWKEKKAKGIQEYILWLNQHNLAFAKRVQGMEVEQLPEGLLEIAKAKVSSFWKMLFAFLFSFITVFQSQDDDSSNS